MLQRKYELSDVKLRCFFGKVLEPAVLHPRQVIVQVATSAKVQHKEQLPVVLERVIHGRDERVV
jgi:hypothetical protein